MGCCWNAAFCKEGRAGKSGDEGEGGISAWGVSPAKGKGDIGKSDRSEASFEKKEDTHAGRGVVRC